MQKSETGFTLIELAVVVLIIGVLSLIAAPSWIGFLNKQRLTVANEKIYLSLKDAQNKAQQQNKSYRASFRDNNGMPQVALELDSFGTPANDSNLWTNISEKPGELTLSLNYGSSMVFNYDGSIKENSEINLGESITINITGQLPNNQQCVKVATLLGMLEKASGTSCN
jgi:prepilin-type N-terminal cleavage/methylation domain-containing protein